MADHANALDIRNLGVRFGSIRALEDFTLSIAGGEHLAVIGPSGSGKTSLLRCVAGLHRPACGTITCGGKLWSDANDPRAWVEPERRFIGMIAQNPGLWPHMTAREHLRFVLRCRGVRRSDRDAMATDMLTTVSLQHRADHRPAELSGGEAQRLALARSLVGGSHVLLLDEPLGQLDVVLRRQLGPEIKRVARVMNATVLHVTHDPADALQLADRIVVIEDGRIAQIGSPQEVVAGPATPFVQQVVAAVQAG